MAMELDSISPIIRLPGPDTFKYRFFIKLRGKHCYPFKYGNKLVHNITKPLYSRLLSPATELTLLSVKSEFLKAVLLVLYSLKSPDPAAVKVLTSSTNPCGRGYCGSLK